VAAGVRHPPQRRSQIDSGALAAVLAGEPDGPRPLYAAAKRIKTSRSIGSKGVCCFVARRRIPAHATALKKYRCGSLPVSKMADNEDSTATLGHSEELSVQNPV